MRTMRLLGPLVLSLTLGTACTYQDTEAPGAPLLETAAGRVRHATVTLRGWAEPGALVTVTREPALDPAPAPTGASEFSGAFAFADVALAPGVKNVFTFRAKDSAGNEGETSTLELELDERPAGVRAVLLRSRVVAGAAGAAGQLEVSAVLDGGEPGYSVADRALVFQLTGPADASKTAATDAAGRASATFEGLTAPGAGSVVVRFGEGDAAVQSDPLAFEVVSGPAATLSLQLRPAGGGDAATGLTIQAGAAVEAVIVAKDGAENRLELPVALTTTAPGAFVEGTRISGLTRVGTWSVTAAVNGVPTAGGAALVATGTITVEAGAVARIVFDTPAVAVAGHPFPWAAHLEDEYGNRVAAPATRVLTVSSSLPAADADIDAAASLATFRRAGPQTLTAELTGGAAPVPATRDVLVAAGPAATVELALTGTDALPATPALEVTAAAAATIAVATTVRDAFGNAVNTGVSLSTDGPALFDGVVLRRLTAAGAFEVRASVPGTLAAGRADYRILPAAPARLQLSLAASQTDAGAPVRYAVGVVDEFGNVTTDAVELVVGAVPGADVTVDAANGLLTVRRAGEHTVTARSGRTGSGVQTDAKPLSVRAAAAATVTVDVGPVNVVRAGETPTFVATVKDAFANTLVNPPVTLSVLPTAGTPVVAPGPVVSGGLVYNLVRPGSYLCLAQVTGTSIANDPADPEATLTVTANVATSAELRLERSVIETGTPIRFTAVMRDLHGNEAEGTLVVAVSQGGTPLATAIASGGWVPPAAGSYTVTATGTPSGASTALPPATAVLTVSGVADLEGPALTFVRPANDPTIAAFPDSGQVVPNGCASNAGDLVSATMSDPSRVAQYWFEFGGLIGSPPAADSLPTLGVPTDSLAIDTRLCSAALTSTTRGELLVRMAATDVRGNFREAFGSWCLDADADSYLPAAGAVRRCAVARATPGLGGVLALGANRAGDVVAARAGAADVATLQLFNRSGPEAYGLGAAHALGTTTAPEGVAFAGRTAFTPVIDGARAVVMRTRALDAAGAGVDDEFVAIAGSPVDRFRGAALGVDGSLYVSLGKRNTDAGGAIYRFERALDYSHRHTALPAAPVASSATARFGRLCEGRTADELYVTGASGTSAALFRLALATTPAVLTEVWVDTVANRTIGDCAATKAGLAVTLSGEAGVMVGLVDLSEGALATPALMTGWATGTALGATPGLARTGSYLFAGSQEAANGSLVRFARDGGF